MGGDFEIHLSTQYWLSQSPHSY